MSYQNNKNFNPRQNNKEDKITLDENKLNKKKNQNIVEDAPVQIKKKKTKFEKREEKIKQNNRWLLSRGIHKSWTTFFLETFYIFIIELLVKILQNTLIFDYTILRIFISSCTLGLIMTIITANLPIKFRNTLLTIFNFVVALYAWLQMGFLNFLGAFISIGNAEQGTKITSYIWEFLCSYKLSYYIIYLPFIGTILYFLNERKITKDGYIKKINFKSLLHDASLFTFLAILSLGYYATLEIDFMQNKYQTISNKSLFKYASNPALTIKNFGTTVFLGLDIKTVLSGEREIIYDGVKVDPVIVPEIDKSRNIDDTAWNELIKNEDNNTLQTLNNYFKNRIITPKNDYTGLLEGKNLIMIMMESIGEAVFMDEYKEYFPTLNKLYNEGITAQNNFSPRNNCSTGESEMTSQISLYSIETTCTVNTYKNNEYQEALSYMLRKNGYYTSAYHDYTEQYYSRDIYEYNFGNYKYYNIFDLDLGYNSIYREWPSDNDFIRSSMDKFINQDKFASYLITVTAHMPYIYKSTYSEKNIDMFENTGLSTYVKRYLSKVKELDLGLEYMLEHLEEHGKLKDTVIVLFGDHYPYGLSEKDYQTLAPYDISTPGDIDRTPFIIYNSELSPERITKYITPLDYTPTLLNLFGIDYDPRYYMGHDVFSDYTDYVVFADNSWLDGNGYYNVSKGLYTPNDETNSISDEDIIKINTEINDMRNMSNLAIKKNYFKYLFNYFEEYQKNQSNKEDKDTENLDKEGEN